MNNLNILSSLLDIKNMFLAVSFYAFIDMIALVFLMKFIDKKNKSNDFVELIVKVVTYSTLFSLLLALVIFIITTYLSSLGKYVLNPDSFTKLILDNTGSILTCITIPVSVIGTLMAKPIGQAISKLNNIIIDQMNKKFFDDKDTNDTNWWSDLLYGIMNSFCGFWIIVIGIPLLDYGIYSFFTSR